MMLFMLIGVIAAFALIVAAMQRPRVSLFVAAAMWASYAVWEYYIATGVLCDKDCNIRVDLVFFFPILLIATIFARMSYVEPSRKLTMIGFFLSAAGVVLVAMGLSLFGYNIWAIVAGAAALALAGWGIRMKWVKGEVVER